MIKNIISFMSPPICYLCEKFLEKNGYLCSNCFEKIMLLKISPPFCNKCGFHKKYKHKCKRGPFLFEEIYGVFYFREELADLIHIYKYRRFKKLYNFFLPFIIDSLDMYLDKDFDFVTSIPLTPAKERERGFNQNEIFARKIGETLKIPYRKNCIFRVKSRKPQASIQDDKKRERNIKGVFYANENIVKDKKILLFDDVMTTGATLNESSKELLQKGAKSVSCFVLAISP